MNLFQKSLVLISILSFVACAEAPVATGYKSKLASQPAANEVQNNVNNSNTTPGATTPGATTPAASGDAAKGAATLAASCESAGCHVKTGGGAHVLVKADIPKIETSAPGLGFHASVKTVFTADAANIKAALSTRP